VLPYDNTCGCAVVQYQEASILSRIAANESKQGLVLTRWANSRRGAHRIGRLAAGLDANLPCRATLGWGAVTVGLISRLAFVREGLLLVDVDCAGEDETQTLKFPLALLPSFVRLCGSEATNRVILNEQEEVRLSFLTSVGAAFRFRHHPLRFSIQRLPTQIEGFPQCCFEVLDVSKVDTQALAAYHMRSLSE
jgi:hypothetical protein